MNAWDGVKVVFGVGEAAYVPPLQFATLPEMLEHAMCFFKKA